MLAVGVRPVQLLRTRPVFAVVLVQLPVFAVLGMLRTVDGDEGFYLLAARLVYEGRLPYVDFMYTQMPLLPYVYGLWMKLFGFNWYAGRLLSALLATTLGTLVFVYAERTFKNQRLAQVGLFLFVTSAFTLAWDTVVMTYALSGLLLFAAFFVLSMGSGGTRTARFIFSGFLLGLAIDTRLLMLAAAPAFIIGVLGYETSTGSRQRRLLQWLAGLTVGLAPALFFVAIDLDAFIFGNLGFHSLRNTTGGLVSDWAQKGAMLAELLNIRSAGGETITFQVPLLLVLNAYHVVLVVRRRVTPNYISILSTALLTVALLLPTPTYSQYFVILLPFVIINGLCALDVLRQDIRELLTSVLRDHFRTALGVFLAAYALVVPIVIYKYVSWLGPTIPGLHQVDPHAWSLPTIRAVSSAIEQSNPPGEEVLTFWPGYLLETRAGPVAGMENHGWMEIGDAGQTRQHPTIASPQSVEMALARRVPSLVVLGILTPLRYRDIALADGYVAAQNVAGVELLKRPD
jgi:hypothetical protein